MLKQLDQAFQFNEANLRLRAQRQQILAANIANADTPNYKARDIDFASALSQAVGSAAEGGRMAVTAPGHIGPGASVAQGLAESKLLFRRPNQDSIDGNTVDMDLERAAFADNAIRYEAGLTSTTSKIRTLMSAIQG